MPYHRLSVYKRSYALALEIHRLTLTFPKIEQYEMAQQLRKSSKSIPANIAEGMGKQESKPDVKRFIRMAWDHVMKRYQEIGRMLQSIIKRYS
jgi:four helix bundle protein